MYNRAQQEVDEYAVSTLRAFINKQISNDDINKCIELMSQQRHFKIFKHSVKYINSYNWQNVLSNITINILYWDCYTNLLYKLCNQYGEEKYRKEIETEFIELFDDDDIAKELDYILTSKDSFLFKKYYHSINFYTLINGQKLIDIDELIIELLSNGTKNIYNNISSIISSSSIPSHPNFIENDNNNNNNNENISNNSLISIPIPMIHSNMNEINNILNNTINADSNSYEIKENEMKQESVSQQENEINIDTLQPLELPSYQNIDKLSDTNLNYKEIGATFNPDMNYQEYNIRDFQDNTDYSQISYNKNNVTDKRIQGGPMNFLHKINNGQCINYYQVLNEMIQTINSQQIETNKILQFNLWKQHKNSNDISDIMANVSNLKENIQQTLPIINDGSVTINEILTNQQEIMAMQHRLLKTSNNQSEIMKNLIVNNNNNTKNKRRNNKRCSSVQANKRKKKRDKNSSSAKKRKEKRKSLQVTSTTPIPMNIDSDNDTN